MGDFPDGDAERGALIANWYVRVVVGDDIRLQISDIRPSNINYSIGLKETCADLCFQSWKSRKKLSIYVIKYPFEIDRFWPPLSNISRSAPACDNFSW